MTTLTGGLRTKPASNNSLIKDTVSWREALLLLGLGAAAVVLHAALRDRFDIAPGHQGLGWIALLVMGRTTSRYRWASVTSAIGAASTAMLPFWGFGDPFRWLTYGLAGLTLDLGYYVFTRWPQAVWLLALFGGLAHMTKPLTRVVISQFTGWPYGSLLWGVAYPAFTHFLFGFFGALIGLGVVWLVNKRPR